MKQAIMIALVALFALSFAIAQDQPAQKEKSATTEATQEKKAGCCADSKGCADMKDCPAMKEMKGAKGSKASKATKQATKTAEVKAKESK